MGRLLATNGALVILAALILLALAATLAIRCFRCVIRRARHLLMATSSIEVSEKVFMNGSR